MSFRPAALLGSFTAGPAPAPVAVVATAWGEDASRFVSAMASGPLCRTASDTERTSLRRDGIGRELFGPVWCPRGYRASAAVRAAAVALAIGVELRGDMVISDDAACWVFTGHTPPSHIDVIVGSRCRRAGVRTHESTLSDRDVERIGACPVTTPVRTALDLVLRAAPSHALEQIGRLEAAGHLDLRAVRTAGAAANRTLAVRTERLLGRPA